MTVKGLDSRTRLPATFTVRSGDIREATIEQIRHIVEAIKSTLDRTPPELSADIYDGGIMLAGGGALLRGLPELITESTGLPVRVAEKPLDCVALGIGKGIEDPRILRHVILNR